MAACVQRTLASRNNGNHQVLLHKSTMGKYVAPALISLCHCQKSNRERKIWTQTRQWEV